MRRFVPLRLPVQSRGLFVVYGLLVLGFAADIAGFNIAAYPPATPVSVRATANFGGTDYIRVTWAPVATATSYRVYRSSTGNSNDFTQVTTTSVTDYSDFVGCGNTVRFYRVTAVADGLESGPSLADDGSTALCFVDTACTDAAFTGPPVAVPDQGSTSMTLNVPNSFPIASVTVRVAIAHTYLADLELDLVSPSGTSVELITDLGSGNDDLLDVTFDDTAVLSFAAATPPFGGTYRPTGSLATLAGEDALGEWRLEVLDDASGDLGAVMAWSLSICPEPGTEDGIQSADLDSNNVLSLSELLRCIQLYNIGGYHCADNPGDTEDGFVPGTGVNQSCDPYDTDYAPQDWIITLTELLRAIQFYNSGGYNYCPGNATEDGFCPGL